MCKKKTLMYCYTTFVTPDFSKILFNISGINTQKKYGVQDKRKNTLVSGPDMFDRWNKLNTSWVRAFIEP